MILCSRCGKETADPKYLPIGFVICNECWKKINESPNQDQAR